MTVVSDLGGARLTVAATLVTTSCIDIYFAGDGPLRCSTPGGALL
jgi:hypothetical protein